MKRLFFLLLFLLSLSAASPLEPPYPPALEELLTLFHIPYEDPLESVVQQTQNCWRRKGERWEVDEIPLSEDEREEIWENLRALGFIDEVQPQKREYGTAVLLGATLPSVRSRWFFLCRLWEAGVQFNKVVLLGSDRPITPEIDWDPAFEDLDLRPQTEMDVIQWVVEHYPPPEGMQQLDFLPVNALGKVEDGEWRRANSFDTLVAWKELEEPQGPLLFFSNQPHNLYQDAVVRFVLGDEYMIETVGPAATPQTKIAVVLDSVARWLFVEHQIQKKI